jgi:glyoxylase-like metal-dependent hydrolase (beta-lactamase superfamily II)
MIEEIIPHIYKTEIPLPGNPLKSINSYVIRDSERSLIIDTGLSRKECMDAMQAALGELGVNLRNTDFFITHLHADHFALLPLQILGPVPQKWFATGEALAHLVYLESKNLAYRERVDGEPVVFHLVRI